MALPGKHARIRVMSKSSTAFTDEATTGDANDLIFTIDDRDKKYWDRNVPITVERNGSLVPENEYRAQYAGGRVYFWQAQNPGDTITVSGSFVAVVIAAECNEYTMAIDAEMDDVTVFESDGWRERLAGIGGISGTVSGFYNINNLFTERLLAQEPLILEMMPDRFNTEIFAVYVVMENQELSAAVEGAVETSVSWQSDGDLLIER